MIFDVVRLNYSLKNDKCVIRVIENLDKKGCHSVILSLFLFVAVWQVYLPYEMGVNMKKRWISLYVENDVGVLAKISGLFSGKSYNLDSLTVGETEDESVSRMTIGLTSDDMTFEQIKKQLNRCVEVIKVVDLTDVRIHMKEILFLKINSCQKEDKEEIFRMVDVFGLTVLDYDKGSVLLECVQTESRNNDIIKLFKESFLNRVEVVKGGSVAIEAVSISSR